MVTLKAWLKVNPYLVLSITMLVSVIFLGVMVRIYERMQITGEQDFSFIWESYWLIILMMTTSKSPWLTLPIVGYGDIYPMTHLGRFSCLVGCIWGLFVYSFFIIAIRVATEFNQSEVKAYESNVN